MLITFDTQEVTDEFKQHGFTDEQASTLTRIHKRVIADAMDNSLDTKSDLSEVHNDLTIDIESVKNRLSIIEKTQWIIITGVIALVIKEFVL